METDKINYLKTKVLNSLLKWPGGKSSDLKYLRSNFSDLFPKEIDKYYEPFLGGGAVWLAVESSYPMFVNDICEDLINFYEYVKLQDKDFFNLFTKLDEAWLFLHEMAKNNWKKIYEEGKISEGHNLNDISLSKDCYPIIAKISSKKVTRIKLVESRNNKRLDNENCLNNIESALKAGYYTYIRDIFNECADHSPLRSVCFYFLRDYCFSSMFRYNSKGEFNVPYGGVSYNSRSPASKVDYWKSQELLNHLDKTTFCNLDFEEFLDKYEPTKEDFMFIDPPYDTEFSTYDKKKFNEEEQKKLATYLIHKTNAQFIAIMKNTDFIYSLYEGHQNINCVKFGKDYQVSFRNRNERNVEHLVVYRVTK